MRWVASGPGWTLAPALVTLGRQLSRVWPEGGPADGTIGDTAHAARKSDHNPNTANVVTAMDVDEVVEDQGAALVATLMEHRDSRIKYVIHEGQIWRSYPKVGTVPWEPSPYTGSNPHSSHVHISVSALSAHYNNADGWNLTGLDEGGNPMASISVKEWQSILNAAGVTDNNGNVLVEDGAYGPKTRSALVKLARGGTVGAHNHNALYPLKKHTHVATTTIV